MLYISSCKTKAIFFLIYYDFCTQMAGMQEISPAASEISSIIDSFKKQVDADRCVYVMVQSQGKIFVEFGE